MIIEKTVTDNSAYGTNAIDYAAEGELTVTITLCEYRTLIRESAENKMRKAHEDWMEQYNRANKAEARVKELEDEVNTLYKRLSKPSEEGKQDES